MKYVVTKTASDLALVLLTGQGLLPLPARALALPFHIRSDDGTLDEVAFGTGPTTTTTGDASSSAHSINDFHPIVPIPREGDSNGILLGIKARRPELPPKDRAALLGTGDLEVGLPDQVGKLAGEDNVGPRDAVEEDVPRGSGGRRRSWTGLGGGRSRSCTSRSGRLGWLGCTCT